MDHLSVSIRDERPAAHEMDPNMLLDGRHNLAGSRRLHADEDDEEPVDDEAFAHQLMLLRNQAHAPHPLHDLPLHQLTQDDGSGLDLDVGEDMSRAVEALEGQYKARPSPKRKQILLLLTLLNNRAEAAEKFVSAMASLLIPREIVPRPPRAVPLGWFARKVEGPRDEFFATFRMYPENFDELFRAIRPHLPARRSCEVPFREIVAATFYSLMHGATLRELEDLFGISAAYLTRLQSFVLRAIIQGLLENGRLGMPETAAEAIAEAARWSAGTGPDDHRFDFLDRCVGAIAHLLIPAVVREPGKVFDADRWRHDRGFTCTNVISIVRHDRTFANAWVGAEGSIPDIQILEWSQAESCIADGFFCLYENPSILTPKLLTPYSDVRFHLSEFTEQQPEYPKSLFNYYHALQRASCTELAIGLLKGRFACLRFGMLANLDTLILKVRSCLVLHNYIQRVHGDDDHILMVAKRAREEMSMLPETGEAVNLSTCFPRLVLPRMETPGAMQWRDRLAEQCCQQSAGQLNLFANDVDLVSLRAAHDMNEYRVRPPYSNKAADSRSARQRQQDE